MNQYELLGKAIEIAVDAHAGQFDKGGKPYILHPLHLMNQLMFDLELAQAAVMHDVVEDSDYYTLETLRAYGFSERVLDMLDRYMKKKLIGTNIVVRSFERNDKINKGGEIGHAFDITYNESR